MRAAILEEPGQFVLSDRPQPEIGSDEVLIRSAVCGICTSELDMWEGHSNIEFPRFAGHEVSGVVEAVGPLVRDIKVGDRVAVYAEGEGFADYVKVPEAWVVKLRAETRFDLALGEPIACAVNGVRKADPQLNDSIAIIGCGFMGLIMLQLFRASGAGTLIAVDRRDSALEMARTLGATHTFNPDEDDVEEEIKSLTDGRGVDIGVEGAGIQATLDLTAKIVRMEGKLEIFGFHQGGRRTVDWGFWNWMAFDVVNGHTRNRSRYVEGMRIGIGMLEQGSLDMDPLVTHRFPLKEINEAFAMASAKDDGFVKGVITF